MTIYMMTYIRHILWHLLWHSIFITNTINACSGIRIIDLIVLDI